MRIKLSFVGFLDIDGVRSGDVIDAAEGSTVADLLTAHGIKPHHQRFVIAAVNGEKKPAACVLHDGDELLLLLPAGGG